MNVGGVDHLDMVAVGLNDSPVLCGKKKSHANCTSDTGSSNPNVEVPPLMPLLNACGLKEISVHLRC